MTSSPDNTRSDNDERVAKLASQLKTTLKTSGTFTPGKPDNTVIQILADLYSQTYASEKVGKNITKYVFETKQSLDSHYLSIFLELVGEPEKGMESKITKTPNGLVIDEWGDIASGFRNALRQELRTALQDRLGEK